VAWKGREKLMSHSSPTFVLFIPQVEKPPSPSRKTLNVRLVIPTPFTCKEPVAAPAPVGELGVASPFRIFVPLLTVSSVEPDNFVKVTPGV
jgi:hypothetical protein